jgi:hypothetical protein
MEAADSCKIFVEIYPTQKAAVIASNIISHEHDKETYLGDL